MRIWTRPLAALVVAGALSASLTPAPQPAARWGGDASRIEVGANLFEGDLDLSQEYHWDLPDPVPTELDLLRRALEPLLGPAEEDDVRIYVGCSGYHAHWPRVEQITPNREVRNSMVPY